MKRILAALGMAASVASPVMASDSTDAVAVLHQWVTEFNKGDFQAAIALCAEEATIVDAFAPYEWRGRDACSKWVGDLQAVSKTEGYANFICGVGRPRHVELKGDRAYLVVPASLKYDVRGKPVKESGSVWTMALEKGRQGWRIVAWTWAEGTDAPVP